MFCPRFAQNEILYSLVSSNVSGKFKEANLLEPRWHDPNTKIKTKVNNKISDEEIISLIEHSNSIRELLLKAGLSTSGANYNRIRSILSKNNITKFNKNFKENFCIDCG